MKNLLLLTIFILTAGGLCFGQSAFSENSSDRFFSLGVNSDAFAGMDLGYAQNPGILAEKNFRIYVRFSFPLLQSIKDQSFDTWEIKTGINSELFRNKNFGTIGDIQLYLIHHNQVLGYFMPLGINVRLTPCYHFSKGYLGIQMNWNQTIAAHISHSRYVKDTFENLSGFDKILLDIDPKDGWYSNTGSHLCFGLESVWKVGSRFFLYGDLGIIKFSSPYTGFFDAMMMGQVPFYGKGRLFYKM